MSTCEKPSTRVKHVEVPNEQQRKLDRTTRARHAEAERFEQCDSDAERQRGLERSEL